MKGKLRTRIAWQFLWRLFVIGFLAVAIYIGTLVLIFNWIAPEEEQEAPRDLLIEVVEQTHHSQGQLHLSTAMQQKIADKKGWLQILDEQGQEVFHVRRPAQVPQQITPGQLVTFKKQQSWGYEWYTWTAERAGQTLTWVYAQHADHYLVTQLMDQHTQLDAGKVTVDAQGINKLKTTGQWLQILDEHGRELFQFQRPDAVPKVYAPGVLAYYHQYAYQQGQLVEIQYREMQGKKMTWIVGKTLPKDAQTDPRVGLGINQQIWMMGVQFFSMLMGLIIILFVSLMFGKRLGEPILHVIGWIRNLASGSYQEPETRGGFPRSKQPGNGQLKRSYRLYNEVIDSMERLTTTLNKNEQEQKRLQQTREEWIAGISHDLKTPLSSVKGYANLLSEEGYHWEESEVRKYADVIRDKAGYIENLIEDLNLTFRLKNEALPLHREETDLIEVVRRSVIDVTNDPRSQDRMISFATEVEAWNYSVDVQWFQRALTNLIINAVIHNPPSTEIDVSVSINHELQSIIIQIQDNGNGMDEETLHHLFDRYYRGTNTAQRSAGTGLGMAIADQLIHAHDGEISIDSEQGVGTTLQIQLPISRSK